MARVEGRGGEGRGQERREEREKMCVCACACLPHCYLIEGLEITLLPNECALAILFWDNLVFLGQLKGKSDRQNENATLPLS